MPSVTERRMVHRICIDETIKTNISGWKIEHAAYIFAGHLSLVFRYFLALAGSNLAQTLLNSPKVVWY